MDFKAYLTEVRQDLENQPRERLVMGEYGEMSNRERAVRVYVSLVLAVPFAQLLFTSSPTAGRSVVALVSFGLSFAVGWRAGYEALHVGDRGREQVEERADELADVGSEVEESGSA